MAEKLAQDREDFEAAKRELLAKERALRDAEKVVDDADDEDDEDDVDDDVDGESAAGQQSVRFIPFYSFYSILTIINNFIRVPKSGKLGVSSRPPVQNFRRRLIAM